ncbi:MAG: iron-containing alcohol dehydrogenase [Holdemanella porci]
MSQEVERTIQNIIVTTGCVSLIVNPEYNSALSHALFYGLTVRQHIEKGHLHGEVVSYGTLVQLMMDNQMELLKKTYRLHEEIGLPICLADLELRRNEDLSDILEKTVINQELRHVPYKVTEELILNAIMKLEDYRG